jgi:hypothetical protein
MRHPLDGCRAKIQRAQQHIRQIHDEIVAGRTFVGLPDSLIRAQYQFRASRIDDPTTHAHELVFSLRGEQPELPLIFSILAGEVCGQLRSTLDHIVYQLILVKTKTPPTFRSQFPIVGAGTKDRPNPADEYAFQKRRMLRSCISGDAEAIIDSLQPFNRGADYQGDPLWILQELSNIDKHRLLVTTVHRVSLYAVTVTNRDKTVSATFTPDIPFTHGAEIGRIPIDTPFTDSETSVDGDLMISIAFDEIAGRKNVVVIRCLTDVARNVGQIVDSLMPDFV